MLVRVHGEDSLERTSLRCSITVVCEILALTVLVRIQASQHRYKTVIMIKKVLRYFGFIHASEVIELAAAYQDEMQVLLKTATQEERKVIHLRQQYAVNWFHRIYFRIYNIK